MAESFKKILIIKPSSLGDIVQTLPALSALRKSFIDAKISWLIRPEFALLIENHPDIDELIAFDREFLGRAWYNQRAFNALLGLIRKLREENFDAVFDFQGLFRTAALGWLCGCKNRFGMKNARELSNLFYTQKVRQDKNCIHVVDYYLKIVQTAGAKNVEAKFIIPTDDKAFDYVNGLLASHDIEPGKFACFVTGSAHTDKCWPIERFAILAEKIYSQLGLKIVASGATSERGLNEKFKLLTKAPVIDLTGKTDLNQLKALLSSAGIVIGNDTGPSHIAAALGVPVVMIFGRSNPARVAPYKKPNSFVAVEPFGRGAKINSLESKYNINNVSVDMVYEKVAANLA
jgi:lipopolysaccharide heptosyltransferase I